MGEMMLARLNDGQRAAFDQIMTAINDTNNVQPRQYFLDGPGGTGKTFSTTPSSPYFKTKENKSSQWLPQGSRRLC